MKIPKYSSRIRLCATVTVAGEAPLNSAIPVGWPLPESVAHDHVPDTPPEHTDDPDAHRVG